MLDRIAENHSRRRVTSTTRERISTKPAISFAQRISYPPEHNNLQVIPTPEFERGIYGVGGFNPAPVLEPQLGAFFWITPDPCRLAEGTCRIEAARIQLLQPEAAGNS